MSHGISEMERFSQICVCRNTHTFRFFQQRIWAFRKFCYNENGTVWSFWVKGGHSIWSSARGKKSVLENKISRLAFLGGEFSLIRKAWRTVKMKFISWVSDPSEAADAISTALHVITSSGTAQQWENGPSSSRRSVERSALARSGGQKTWLTPHTHPGVRRRQIMWPPLSSSVPLWGNKRERRTVPFNNNLSVSRQSDSLSWWNRYANQCTGCPTQ